MTANGYKFSFWGDENILSLDCVDGQTTVNMTKPPELYTVNGWI